MNEKTETYKLIFEHFKLMEHRYHTWMNYYSLFNGALLVAYCTILVSVGKIVEKSSYAMPMEDHADGRVLFSLDCTYWEFLMLIATLGVIASICWLRSMQGHTAWLENWRNALKNVGYEFDWTIYVDAGKCLDVSDEKLVNNLKLYSTAKITTVFIISVMLAWILAGIYAIINSFSINLDKKTITLGMSAICIFFICVSMYLLNSTKTKSDVSGFKFKRVSVVGEIPNPSNNLKIKALDLTLKILSKFVH